MILMSLRICNDGDSSDRVPFRSLLATAQSQTMTRTTTGPSFLVAKAIANAMATARP